MLNNPILLSDSYKVSHWKQYPPKTQKLFSYFESRGGMFKETVFFGLQYVLKEYLIGQIITPSAIAEAEGYCREHLPQGTFNYEGWDHIRRDHGGCLPLSIHAQPEGTVLPTRTPLISVENTCPKCFWVTNYFETLLVQTWYACTVATLSREIKKMLRGYRKATGSEEGLDFGLHDFGFRGASSVETAAIGGAAHLVNFLGSDTMVALKLAREYYNARPVPGFSVPAAEHSTITSWGRENEWAAYKNMLEQYPTGPVAVVSDSYDIYNACENLWGGVLKDIVMKRFGFVVVRPDSGDPVTVVNKVLDILGARFGYTVNDKGYKVLDPHVRVIQGDGVNHASIDGILHTMQINKWAAENLTFGMGGALLQKVDRDTQKMAFKASHIIGEDFDRDVYKDPITDPGKKSKRGYVDAGPEVFRNGRLLIDHDFREVVARAAA
jgi:nicotinamide phosphoribosyltransferase